MGDSPFDRLHPLVQRWVWRQGWTELRPIQANAIGPILDGESDVLLAASTASGKTEAAFLPALTRALAARGDQPAGCQVLYVSPLKALINDQLSRLELMTEDMGLPVTPWHGDASQAAKRRFLKRPDGCLLITPESLESLFANQGGQVRRLFDALLGVVIDEVHSYIGGVRGKQLQSLLHRLELVLRRRVPRIGLSATLGDMSLAAEYLRAGAADDVILVEDAAASQTLKVQLLGYVMRSPNLEESAELPEQAPTEPDVLTPCTDGSALQVSQDLFRVLRGSYNLIFANSRRATETYADILRRLCEVHHLPVEFLPHHGSLSAEIREHVETLLKKRERPINVVTTSTLELGIDIGSVKSIAQVGSPFEVSSLRQRLGRSGRRAGEPAILRIFIQERELNDRAHFLDQLRVHLVQAVAMVQLLLKRWNEPPNLRGLHYSTMIQQILSIVAQTGGASAQQLWNVLCASDGPFGAVSQEQFTGLLRQMGHKDLLIQSPDGTLLHGGLGERLANHFSFYAAFQTPDEFTLYQGERRLGTLPIDRPVEPGSHLIFAGRRWRVLSIDPEKKVIDLAPAPGGIPPAFGGTGGSVHDRVREEMLTIYRGSTMPLYLDAGARALLEQGREAFRRNGLDEQSIIEVGEVSMLFPWRGDRVLDTLMLMLRHSGLTVEPVGIALAVHAGSALISHTLKAQLEQPQPDPLALARHAANARVDKYDGFLTEEQVQQDYASRRLDVAGAMEAIDYLLH